MGALLRKYGAAAQIDGIVLIALGAMDYQANPTLAAGDVTISKDGGAFNSIEGAGTFGDFVAVAPAAGTSVQVKPDSTAMTCKTLIIRFIDQTSPKEWEDQEVMVETYGHASAMHPFDLGSAKAPATIAAGDLASDSITAAAFKADAAAEIADAIWDELLAAHTIKKSAADYVKKGGGGSTVTLFAGTAQGGAALSITLATDIPNTANLLNQNLVVITGGTGAGQTRRIVAYSTGRVATVDRAWVTPPNATSTYEVMAAAASVLADEGTVAAATSTTIQLANSAPTGNASLDGAMVTITSGNGQGETKVLSNYVGASRTADVDSAWSVTPNSSSTYAVIPAAQAAGDTGGGVAAPSAAEIAAVILSDPDNRLLTDADGHVTADVTGSVTVSGEVTLAESQPNLAGTGIATAANQATLLARLGAFTGTGVNTVFGFFKALLSKAASTPSDVGGTFDAAADSTEAIRDAVATSSQATTIINNTSTIINNTENITTIVQGNAAWAGSGSEDCTIYVKDDNGDPIADVDVEIIAAGDPDEDVVASGKTDSFGVIQPHPNLDPGSYYVNRQKTGMDFDNPQTITVT